MSGRMRIMLCKLFNYNEDNNNNSQEIIDFANYIIENIKSKLGQDIKVEIEVNLV